MAGSTDSEITLPAHKVPAGKLQKSQSDKNFYAIVWMLTLAATKRLMEFEVQGKEHLPKKGAYIHAVAGHNSFIDPLVASVVTERQVNFMSKQELFNNIIPRTAFEKLGAFRVNRESGGKAALGHASILLKMDEVVGIFPEGKIEKDEKSTNNLDFKNGASHLAVSSQVPVAPIGLAGTEKIFRRILNPWDKPKIVVVITEPIHPDQAPDIKGIVGKDKRTAMAGKVNPALQANYDKANDSVEIYNAENKNGLVGKAAQTIRNIAQK